jgi:hypothetical protein
MQTHLLSVSLVFLLSSCASSADSASSSGGVAPISGPAIALTGDANTSSPTFTAGNLKGSVSYIGMAGANVQNALQVDANDNVSIAGRTLARRIAISGTIVGDIRPGKTYPALFVYEENGPDFRNRWIAGSGTIGFESVNGKAYVLKLEDATLRPAGTQPNAPLPNQATGSLRLEGTLPFTSP